MYERWIRMTDQRNGLNKNNYQVGRELCIPSYIRVVIAPNICAHLAPKTLALLVSILVDMLWDYAFGGRFGAPGRNDRIAQHTPAVVPALG